MPVKADGTAAAVTKSKALPSAENRSERTTLAAGSLVRGGLEPSVGAHAVMIAVLMNTLAKGGIAIVTGGWRYGMLYFGAAFAATAAAAGVWVLVTPLLAPMFG